MENIPCEFEKYVKKPEIKVYPKIHDKWRYFLYVPFEMEQREAKKALVIQKNPSNAKINHEESVYVNTVSLKTADMDNRIGC